MAATMSERLDVTVTYDARHGYIASAPELRQPVVALSLGGLRRKIEIAMLPDNVRIVLQLDGLAERERHHRRRRRSWRAEPLFCGQNCFTWEFLFAVVFVQNGVHQ